LSTSSSHDQRLKRQITAAVVGAVLGIGIIFNLLYSWPVKSDALLGGLILGLAGVLGWGFRDIFSTKNKEGPDEIWEKSLADRTINNNGTLFINIATKEDVDTLTRIRRLPTENDAVDKDKITRKEFNALQQELKDQLETINGLKNLLEEREANSIKAGDVQVSHSDLSVKVTLLKGSEYYAKRRYNDAIESYNTAIKIDPNNADTWNNKGRALYHLGKYEEAVKCSEKAIEINPNSHQAWYNKGRSLYQLGKYKEAIRNLDEAIKLYEEAIRNLDEAIKLAPRYVYLSYKGRALYHLGKYEEALKYSEEAIKINPNYAVAWNNKGRALDKLGKQLDAKSSFDKARQLGYRHRTHNIRSPKKIKRSSDN
jgi:tetratricopeptide (TPR) repeat protein